MALSRAQFGDQLAQSGLMSAADIEAVVKGLPTDSSSQDGEALARELVRRQKLTAFQAQEIFEGRGNRLVLGEYVVLDKLGQGGMGMVLKAEHRRMKRVVAIKVLSPNVTKTPAMLARFQREVQAAAKLSHQNIVIAHDAGESAGTHFLVMEFVEGTDLSALVKRNGPLPIDQALHCVIQAARGLEYAHGRGVVHRDIKPANLLLDRDGTVKILDMGLARLDDAGESPDELTGTGQIMGTVDYMAPEQALSTKSADRRADIYSLGITLWYLLTGRPAYTGETTMARLVAHRERPIPSIHDACPAAPHALDAVFARMVAKTPEARYQTITQAIADLERCRTAQEQGRTGRDVSAPALSSAAGEDGRLDAFLRGLEQSAASRSVTGKQLGKGPTVPAVAAPPVVEDALANTIPLGDTDPTTEQLVGASNLVSPRPAWLAKLPFAPTRRNLALAGSAAVLLFAGVAALWWINRPTVRVADGDLLAPASGRVSGGSPIASQASGGRQPPGNAAIVNYQWPTDAPAPAIAPFDAAQAKKHQQEWAEYLGVPVEWENSIGMKFVLIPPGEFMMGSTPEEIEAAMAAAGNEAYWTMRLRSEAPRHKVILTEPIYLGVHEVTQSQYEQVIGTNPSHFAATGLGKDSVVGLDTSAHPVELVSWNDAAEFCAKLSEKYEFKPVYFRSGQTVTILNGNGYRLPTEAEWEFACRSGTTTRFWIGDHDEDLNPAGWLSANSGRRTHAVGELTANPLGLFDIHGNVYEWVQDVWEPTYYDRFQNKPAINATAPSSLDILRVVRGGSWGFGADSCRSSHRNAGEPARPDSNIGFRVALPVDAVKRALTEGATSSATGTRAWHGWPADAPAPAIAPFDAAQAKKHQQEWAEYLGVPVEYENSIGMKFVLIPPGEFMMGSTPEEIEAALLAAGNDENGKKFIRSEAPRHVVVLTQPIYLGIHEVTQKEYEQVMGTNPSHFSVTGEGKEAVANLETRNYPVEMVSWNDAAEFCAKLTEKEQLEAFYFRSGDTVTMLDGNGYRLSTEAEWEFACRAGMATKYWTGDEDASLVGGAWIYGNSGGRTHAVAELQANPFGLYDIHGNVWEWVQEGWEPTYYGHFQEKPAIDPSGPSSAGSVRMSRGGSWGDNPSNCRSSDRGANGPTSRHRHLGFRVVLPVDAVKAAIAEQSFAPRLTEVWHGWPADAPAPAIAPFDSAQARKHQVEWADYLGVPVEWENSIGIKFRLIPPGEFLMGSTPEEVDIAIKFDPEEFWEMCTRSEAPRHKVILTQPIYIGIHEVTQEQYLAVMKTNPSWFSITGGAKEAMANRDTQNLPVDTVTWNDAVEFCTKLAENDRLRPFYARSGDTVTMLNGTGYRLPTEAEWEFACRAGTTTKFFSGEQDESLLGVGWIVANCGGYSHVVGELQANPFGLYDMLGNVFEHVQDLWGAKYYDEFVDAPAIDPLGPSSALGLVRAMRGGYWNTSPALTRCATRYAGPPTVTHSGIGFRVALPVDAVKAAIAARSSDAPLAAGWHGWPATAPPPAIAPFDAAQAKKHQQEWAAYLGVPVEWENSIGMKFVLIPPGEFTMGSTSEEIEAALKAGDDWKEYFLSEAPQHPVTHTRPFYLGVHEVTQAQYQQVTGVNPSYFAPTGAGRDTVVGFDTGLHPVEMLTWNDAVDLCAMLSKTEALTPYYRRDGELLAVLDGTGYRLPTEAEWEFACRAGTITKFWNGNSDEDVMQGAWTLNSAGRTHVVGELKANPLGLYDMLGNVCEWVEDAWDPTDYAKYQGQAAIDPRHLASARMQRIFRGGNWNNFPSTCRSSTRIARSPTDSGGGGYGVRLALSTAAVKSALGDAAKPQVPGDWTYKPVAVTPPPLPAASPWDALDRAKIDPYELTQAGQGDPAAAPPELVAIAGDSLLKHSRGIAWGGLAFLPDNRTVVAGSLDGTVKLWDVETGRATATLKMDRPVMSMAVSPNGRTLAIGLHDGDVQIWDLESRQRLGTLPGTNLTWRLVFSQDGRWLATAPYNDNVGEPRIWDSAARTLRFSMVPPGERVAQAYIAFHPDGQRVATTHNGRSLQFWNLETGKPVGHVKTPANVLCFAIHPGGRQAALGVNDVAPKQHLVMLDLGTGNTGPPVACLGGVNSLAFDSAGNRLSVGGFSGVRLWNLRDAETPALLLRQVKGNVTAAGTSPDDRLAAFGDAEGQIHLLRMQDATPIHPIDSQGRCQQAVALGETLESGNLTSLEFSGIVRRSRIRDGILLRSDPLDFGQHGYECGSFANDGRLGLFPSWHGQVDVFDLSKALSNRSFQTLPAFLVGDAHLSPDSRRIALACREGNVALLADTEGDEPPHALKGHDNPVIAVALSPDGQTVATRGEDGTVRLWDANTEEQLAILSAPGPTGAGQMQWARLQFSPDGSNLASVACDREFFFGLLGGEVRVWDLATGKERFHYRPDDGFVGGMGIAWHPNGTQIACTTADGRVRLLNARTGAVEREIRVGPRWGIVGPVIFSRDGRHLFVANGNGTIFVLRLVPAPDPNAAAAIDWDRKVAEWAIGLKAPITIESDGVERNVYDVPALPEAPFRVAHLDLASQPKLTDNDLEAVGKLQHLKTLILASNKQLTARGFGHLHALTACEYLNANGTLADDEALASIGKLKRLKQLHLSHTLVTDRGLTELIGLNLLEELSLNFTAVGDSGMQSVAALRNLRSLHLGETPVGDQGLARLAPLTQLETIGVGPPTTDTGFAHLAGFLKLQYIGIKSHQATDVAIGHLRNLPALTELYIVGATDADLARLTVLRGIRTLTLDFNQVTAAGLSEIKSFPNLESLNLGNGSTIGDDHLADPSRFARLRVLYLHNTGITDTGLVSLANVTNLRELNVQQTQVTADGVARLHAALPACRIYSDHGTFEPTAKDQD